MFMDHLTPAKRSWNMAKIRSNNTRPEREVRSLLHKMGYRFRVNHQTLPGKPDIVLKRFKTVIFVNGCFWHGHKNCSRSNIPKSNTTYWINKIETNKKRDGKNVRQLRKEGWKVITVWECHVQKTEKIKKLFSTKISFD